MTSQSLSQGQSQSPTVGPTVGRDPGPGVRRAAFFDADQTLITVTSPVDFWHYWSGAAPTSRFAVGRRLPEMTPGSDREELNRAYYRLFAGVPSDELLRAGERWYHAYRARAGGFVPATLAALRRHRAAGDLVVLVSGSPRACLAPLAVDLGADRVICAEQEVAADGRLTGGIVRPVIGPAKAEAAAELMRRLGLAPADCYGYGDHHTDLALLELVGHPTVVGADPVLAERAARTGWPVLPGC